MKAEVEKKDINNNKDDKNPKNNNNKFLLKVVIAVILLIVLVFVSIIIYNMLAKLDESKFLVPLEYRGYNILKGENGKIYYVMTDSYPGEYDIQNHIVIDGEEKKDNFDTEEVMDYYTYSAFCRKYKIKKKYRDRSVNYIVITNSIGGGLYARARLADVEYNSDTVTLYIWQDMEGGNYELNSRRRI